MSCNHYHDDNYNVCPELLRLTKETVNKVGTDDYTPLVRALLHNHTQCVAHILSLGANVNIPWAMLPISVAIGRNSEEQVDLLLRHGASVNSLQSGRPILNICCNPTGREILHTLLDHGSDYKERNQRLPNIPFIEQIYNTRESCRRTARLLYGLRRFRGVSPLNDVNVFHLIGKHIWSTRQSLKWDDMVNYKLRDEECPDRYEKKVKRE